MYYISLFNVGGTVGGGDGGGGDSGLRSLLSNLLGGSHGGSTVAAGGQSSGGGRIPQGSRMMYPSGDPRNCLVGHPGLNILQVSTQVESIDYTRHIISTTN